MAENYYERSNDPIVFNVVEELGVLSMHNNGWNREVNIVSWNGRPAKIDIRDWDPEHRRMSKGITLRENEALRMAEILIGRLGPYGRRRGSSLPAAEPADQSAAGSQYEDPEAGAAGGDSLWDEPQDYCKHRNDQNTGSAEAYEQEDRQEDNADETNADTYADTDTGSDGDQFEGQDDQYRYETDTDDESGEMSDRNSGEIAA